MTYLTTHILDTAHGCPAVGVRIDLHRIDGSGARHLTTAISNADGRTDAPLLDSPEFRRGVYELSFHMGAYFQAQPDRQDVPFLDVVPIRFGIADPDRHYHIPLLVTPWSYATYRGS